MNIKYKKYFIEVGILIILTIFNIDMSNAANFCVRKGASGNGSSWTNAWDDIDDISGIGSGDTVYIASGNYTGTYTANSNGWTLKRATVDQHGSNTGWSDGYDGTVKIQSSGSGSGQTFDLTGRNSITIDGVDRSKFLLSGNNGSGLWYGIHTSGILTTSLLKI